MNVEQSEAVRQMISSLLSKVCERRTRHHHAGKRKLVDYEPLTPGIQAALPHIDNFLPLHNLASLEDLANRLADINSSSNGGNHARYPA